MIGYIYLIRNRINGKLYVGQTIGELCRRWAVHCCQTNKSNSAITKAIAKYGKSNFEMIPIETIEDDNKDCLIGKLNLLEKSYIQSLRALVPRGYNILLGGNNAKKPDSIKLKISMALKGNPKMKSQLGKKFSKEHKEKLSKASKWSKSLICLENNAIYSSITEASKKTNVPRTSLSKSLRKYGIYEGRVTLKYLGT